MIPHEARFYAESLRQMLVQGYMNKGDAFGHALAARCAWIVGEVVTDCHGRVSAIALLDATSDALNRKAETTPMPELLGLPELEPQPGAMPGIDATTIPGHWIVPAPRNETELRWVFNLMDSALRLNGRDGK